MFPLLTIYWFPFSHQNLHVSIRGSLLLSWACTEPRPFLLLRLARKVEGNTQHGWGHSWGAVFTSGLPSVRQLCTCWAELSIKPCRGTWTGLRDGPVPISWSTRPSARSHMWVRAIPSTRIVWGKNELTLTLRREMWGFWGWGSSTWCDNVLLHPTGPLSSWSGSKETWPAGAGRCFYVHSCQACSSGSFSHMLPPRVSWCLTAVKHLWSGTSIV